MVLPAIDWEPVLPNLIRVAIAYCLVLPLGWNRGKLEHGLSLRTFPLVALAACGYVLIGEHVFGDNREAQARIVQGLMTGIGFVGAGAIMKEGGTVHGAATAATIWNTGAIGAAVAFGRYEIAVILTAVNFATLHLSHPYTNRDKPPSNEE